MCKWFLHFVLLHLIEMQNVSTFIFVILWIMACSWQVLWAHLFLHQHIYFYWLFNLMICPLFASLRPPLSVLLDNSCFASIGLLLVSLCSLICLAALLFSLIYGQENYLPSQQCMMGDFLGITAVGRNISEHSRWLCSSAHWLLTASSNRDNTYFHTNTSIDQRMSPHHTDSSA